MRAIVFLVLFFASLAGLEGAISQQDWQLVESYLLPEEHPARKPLDAIFKKRRATKSITSVRKAGFVTRGAGKCKKIIVATHSKIPGYIFKFFCDQQPVNAAEKLSERIMGARVAEAIIERHGYSPFLKVPHKWIYVIPRVPAREGSDLKHFVLVAEDMELVSTRRNLELWKSSEMTNEKLNAIYTVVTEGGFYDMFFPWNLPFSFDGKIALTDTERFGQEVNYSRLSQYLDPLMIPHWNMLMEENPSF